MLVFGIVIFFSLEYLMSNEAIRGLYFMRQQEEIKGFMT